MATVPLTFLAHLWNGDAEVALAGPFPWAFQQLWHGFWWFEYRPEAPAGSKQHIGIAGGFGNLMRQGHHFAQLGGVGQDGEYHQAGG